MNAEASISRILIGGESILDEVVGLLGGAGFTFVLFAVIAGFEGTDSAEPRMEIEDLRPMSIPLDAPPPKPVERVESLEPPTPLAGLEIAPSDSPVKIAVVPPDLAVLIPVSDVPPPATIQQSKLYTEFKPRTEISADFKRIFQQSEVDRKPTREITPNPKIPENVRRNAASLRVRLLMVIDEEGRATGVRITRSSGNEKFDQIIAECVAERWVFTPAIKSGRRVKCLIEQPFTVVWRAGSPFSL